MCDVKRTYLEPVRLAIRIATSRLLYRTHSARRSLRRYRLDNSSHCGQRQIKWPELVHRDHEPLFWLEWKSGGILLSIRFRLWRYVLHIHSLLAEHLPTVL